MTNFLNLALIMVGNKENNAILEALKHLFQHFSSAFSACCLNSRRKIEKGLFILIQNRGPTPCSTQLQQPCTCILKLFLTVTAKSFVPLFRRKKQAFTNCVHGYDHARNVHTNGVTRTQKRARYWFHFVKIILISQSAT